MPTDPREPVTVEIVPDPIPRALFHSLITAFADVAADYGLTIGGRILGEAGTRRAGGSDETRWLRVRVAELEAQVRELIATGAELKPFDQEIQECVDRADARAHAAENRVAELEGENAAVDEGRPEALDALLSAVAASLPEETPEERADWAVRNYRRAHRVAVRATRRVDELRAQVVELIVAEQEARAALVGARRRADITATERLRMAERAELAEETAQARDELLGQWVARVEAAAGWERRATAAEAQVAAVRETLDELDTEAEARRGYREAQAAERAGLIMAITGIREALDAASTPAETSPSEAP